MSEIYEKEPLRYHNNFPVFSEVNDYTNNYEQISKDHLIHFRQHGINPFMSEQSWKLLETSTIGLVKKYAKTKCRILDVGVGMGRLLSHFPDLQRFGVDISYGYLCEAQKKGIEVSYSLIEELPYKKKIFDVVVCTDVLEHVFNLVTCCEKILYSLKQGGFLIVRVPNREDLTQYLLSTYPYEYVHLRNFDENSLQLLFNKVFGCELCELLPVYSTPTDYLLKYRLPIPLFNRLIIKCLNILRKKHESLFYKLLKFLFYPNEINLVVRKK